MGYFLSILIPLYFIFVNTDFFSIGKEIVFLVSMGLYLYWAMKNKFFYINKIIFFNIIFFVCTFAFIVYWDISKIEYELFLYRKFQYIFMMFFPIIFYFYNRNTSIIKYLSLGIFFLDLFLIFNLLANYTTLSYGSFQGGFLLSRPGAGVLALMPVIYFGYIIVNFHITKIYKFFFALSFFVSIAYIILTGSKTAGFGMVLLFALFLVRNFQFSLKKILFILSGIISFFIVIPVSYFSDIFRLFRGDELSSSMQRFIEWNISIDLFKEHWIFGIGWKHYGEMINSSLMLYAQELFPSVEWKYISLAGDSSAQNVFLDNLAIYGILGVIYNFFIVFLLYKVYKIDTLKSYILLFLFILLSINTFTFGNGYEPIFWFLLGIIFLKDEIYKNFKKGNYSNEYIN